MTGPEQYGAVAAGDGLAWNRALPVIGDVLPTIDEVLYGPDVSTEGELRLLGNVGGKRVLELGCGTGQALVVFARQGAHAIGLDFSQEMLSAAKRLSEQEKVRVEVHHGDLADLAFQRADSVDLAFSSYALAFVDDLNRVFRQVHRVLRQDAPFVFSLPHPAYGMIDDDNPDAPLMIRRSYFERPRVEHQQGELTAHHHTLSDVFTGLTRAKFRVEVLLEPEPAPDGPRSPHWRETFRWVPRTLVVRARKEGT